MADKTFTWQMNMGATADNKHNASVVRFGDGYAQRVAMGIHNKRCNWSGTKTGDLATTIRPIMDFLDEHKGVKAFLWTNPLGQTHRYICQDYNLSQRKGNFWQISLNFEQVF